MKKASLLLLTVVISATLAGCTATKTENSKTPSKDAAASGSAVPDLSTKIESNGEYQGIATVKEVIDATTLKIVLPSNSPDPAAPATVATVKSDDKTLFDNSKFKTIGDTGVKVGDDVGVIWKSTAKQKDGSYILFSFVAPDRTPKTSPAP